MRTRRLEPWLTGTETFNFLTTNKYGKCCRHYYYSDARTPNDNNNNINSINKLSLAIETTTMFIAFASYKAKQTESDTMQS